MTQKNSWRPQSRLLIGEFVADPTCNEISSNGVSTRLRPILMDVLLRLAAEAGAVVGRETLLNDVWPRRVVNDEVLSRAVAELRTALGDDPKNSRYIETLPKVGYRLIATVVAKHQTQDQQTTADALQKAEPSATMDTLGSAHRSNIATTAPSLNKNISEIATIAPDNRDDPSKRTQKLSLRTVVGLMSVSVVLFASIGFYQARPEETFARISADLQRRLNDAVPFATSPNSESSPRFSPDGKFVAFARNSETLSEIVVQHVGNRSERTFSIPNARLATPVFFPNGKQIAYWIRRSDSIDGKADCAVALRDLELATDTVIVDCQQRPQPVFDITPDGRALIYSAVPRSDAPIALMQRDLKTGTTRQLTSPAPGDGHDSYPRISPDGKSVAFFRGTQSHARPWTIVLKQQGTNTGDVAGDQGTPKAVSQIKGLSYGLAWLAQEGTESSLVAAADWLGFRALNALSTADGSVRLLGARGARFPDVDKNGSIVFETATYRADLWLTSATHPGDGARMRWPSTRYTSQPQFSPDGLRVVFASNRSGGDAIHVANIAAPPPGNPDDAQRLAFPDSARYIQPRWSSDGNTVFALQIAAKSDQSVEQRIVSMHLESGRVNVLTHLGHQVQSAIPLANGREIVYGEIADHSMRLFRALISGGTPVRLPLPLVSSFAIVDNVLVYTQPQLLGATRCELDTLKCAPLNAEIGDSNRFDWTLSKDALWFVSRTAQRKPQLIRLNLLTGARTAFDYAPSASGINIAASADGRWLIIAREAPVDVDLMIAKAVK